MRAPLAMRIHQEREKGTIESGLSVYPTSLKEEETKKKAHQVGLTLASSIAGRKVSER